MGESTGISWTDHTFVRPATSGPQPKPARSGDKLQARQRVNVEVRSGRRPHPNTLPCTDCGHVADCADLGVALWVKQMGDAPHAGYDGPDAGDDSEDHIRPVKFKAHHGADPSEWPGHLQVQQFPKEALP